MKQSGLQEKHRSIVSLGLRKGDVGKLYRQVTLHYTTGKFVLGFRRHRRWFGGRRFGNRFFLDDLDTLDRAFICFLDN